MPVQEKREAAGIMGIGDRRLLRHYAQRVHEHVNKEVRRGWWFHALKRAQQAVRPGGFGDLTQPLRGYRNVRRCRPSDIDLLATIERKAAAHRDFRVAAFLHESLQLIRLLLRTHQHFGDRPPICDGSY